MQRIRTVIVEDNHTIATEIRDFLGREPDMEVVGLSYDGLDAIDLVMRTQPDVVLIDLGLPVIDGIEAIRRIRSAMPLVEFLVLTVQDDGCSLFQAFQAGAKGYELKSATFSEIADSVRRVARGESAIPPGLIQTMCEEFDRVARQPLALLKLFDQLTPTEIRTLKLIGESMTNVQIAEALFVTPGAVKGYVTSILRKLEVNNRVEAGYIARQSGLLSSKAGSERQRARSR